MGCCQEELELQLFFENLLLLLGKGVCWNEDMIGGGVLIFWLELVGLVVGVRVGFCDRVSFEKEFNGGKIGGGVFGLKFMLGRFFKVFVEEVRIFFGKVWLVGLIVEDYSCICFVFCCCVFCKIFFVCCRIILVLKRLLIIL